MEYEKVRILVVEDDPQIRNFMMYCLHNEDFPCECAACGKQALSMLISEPIDLMLLDLGLPDMDGMDMIRHVREWSQLPIIVVSARDQDKEKAAALDGGADDYITKPFSAMELMARIRAALRHRKQDTSTKKMSFEVRGLKIDYVKRIVSLNGQAIHVTPMEYSMLVLLSQNAGKVLTTQMLLKTIWGSSYGTDTQALRALMAGLRRKIETSPADPSYIFTEIGVGYRMADE